VIVNMHGRTTIKIVNSSFFSQIFPYGVSLAQEPETPAFKSEDISFAQRLFGSNQSGQATSCEILGSHAVLLNLQVLLDVTLPVFIGSDVSKNRVHFKFSVQQSCKELLIVFHRQFCQ
jgi:hypothetical protein